MRDLHAMSMCLSSVYEIAITIFFYGRSILCKFLGNGTLPAHFKAMPAITKDCEATATKSTTLHHYNDHDALVYGRRAWAFNNMLY